MCPNKGSPLPSSQQVFIISKYGLSVFLLHLSGAGQGKQIQEMRPRCLYPFILSFNQHLSFYHMLNILNTSYSSEPDKDPTHMSSHYTNKVTSYSKEIIKIGGCDAAWLVDQGRLFWASRLKTNPRQRGAHLKSGDENSQWRERMQGLNPERKLLVSRSEKKLHMTMVLVGTVQLVQAKPGQFRSRLGVSVFIVTTLKTWTCLLQGWANTIMITMPCPLCSRRPKIQCMVKSRKPQGKLATTWNADRDLEHTPVSATIPKFFTPRFQNFLPQPSVLTQTQTLGAPN